MNIIVSKHAVQRKYERFHFLENITYQNLKQEIINDLQKYTIIQKRGHDIFLVKGIKSYYIVSLNDIIMKVITSLSELYTKINYEDIIFKTKLEIEDTKKYIIVNVLQNNDYILIAQIGSKLIMVIEDLLLVVRKDYKLNKIEYLLLEKYELSNLYEVDKINLLREKVFNDVSFTIWDYFTKLLNINEFIFKYSKLKEQDLDYEIKIYKQVLEGSLSKFPLNFWQEDIGGLRYEGASLCTKYLFNDILKWNLYNILNNFNVTTLKKYKLGGMLEVLFNGNSYYALVNAYPEIKPWQLKKIKFDWYFRKDSDGVQHSKEAIKWLLIEAKNDGYNITNNNLLNFDWKMILKKYNMLGILTSTFDNYKDFFKECFDVQFTDVELSRYSMYFELNKGGFTSLRR